MVHFEVHKLYFSRGNPGYTVRGSVMQVYRFCLDCMTVNDFAPISGLMSDMEPLLRTMLTGDPPAPAYRLALEVILSPLSITVPCASLVEGRDRYLNAVQFYLEALGHEVVH